MLVKTKDNKIISVTVNKTVFNVGFTSKEENKIHLFREGSTTTLCAERDMSNKAVYFSNESVKITTDNFVKIINEKNKTPDNKPAFCIVCARKLKDIE